MSTENKALWSKWEAIWNGKLELADEVIAPDFEAHYVPLPGNPAEVRGPEGLKQWISGLTRLFSDARFTTHIGPLADEDKLVGRWILTGRYAGGMPGTPPEAVGKPVEVAGVDILRIENGKIAEYWLSADVIQMMQQIGMF